MNTKVYVLAMIALISLIPKVTAQNQSKKPNILWILTDDQRKDSNGYYNQITSGKNDSPLGYVSSPNLDALAKEGIVFTNMYCNSPACAPSRNGILAGKYPHHSGVYGFEYFNGEAPFFTKTMPQIMAENGYETSLFGKAGYRNKSVDKKSKEVYKGFYQQYILDTELSKAGITDWNSAAIYGKQPNGKSGKLDTRVEFYYPNGEKKSWSRENTISDEEKAIKASVEKELDILYHNTTDGEESGLIIGGVNSMPADKTLDGNILTEYLNYLKNQGQPYKSLQGIKMNGADSRKPIFTSLSFHFPHTPVMPPKEFRDRFKDKVYKIPEFDKKEELSKLPKQLVDLYKKLQIDGYSYKEKQQAIRDYYAFCAYGDFIIGKAIEAFKVYSQKNNQEYVILYTSGDHGWQLGEQGIESKFSPWDLSTHTTGILVSSDKKAIPAGKVYEGFTEYVDIMPTVLAAGGVDLSDKEYDFLDGYNMAALYANKKLNKEYIIGEINSVAGPRTYMRTRDFAFSMRPRPLNGGPGGKYKPNENVRWGLDAPREEVQLALYDLRKDPMERNNVANDKKYIELTDWFRKKLGNIVLGDGRIECDWKQKDVYSRTDFALGADDKKINIPSAIIPK
ncbi:sulfatase-like hydrolase/transferase [Flavobacterium sp. NG2]|uniref:sulfatase-like hydrolase/transferase n=1 Tax=Flavobacterium sp. NG2 TaxID=3097547 RepID=UPI002A816BBF|nr:sulfatase-like hydrolase/transferase [Flavobacterium sp. NG2]WPR73090.1 sulfatase-like hydrolase/transferase [Flavobacterium sp. NG2]